MYFILLAHDYVLRNARTFIPVVVVRRAFPHKAREQRWLALEASVRKAASASQFGEAADARDELLRLEMAAVGGVLAANSAFYRCFSARDASGMAALWEPNGWASCTHPGQQPLMGYEVSATQRPCSVLGRGGPTHIALSFWALRRD